MAVRAAVGGLIVLALQGCAGEQRSLGSSTGRQQTSPCLGDGSWRHQMPRRVASNLAAHRARAAERLRPMADAQETSI